MIIAKQLVSLLNSSILGNLFQLKRKEIGDFIDKYFTRANPNSDDEIIETDDRNDVLGPKSVTDPRNLMYQYVLTFRVPYCPVPPLAKHAGTSRSAPRWTHSFSARFWSVWREFGNKTFLNYYGTLPVSFMYSLLSAPRGTWSEIWFFFFIVLWSTCNSYVGHREWPIVYCTFGWFRSQWGRKQWQLLWY